ncbi:alpha/beta hydrolase [Curvibacter sp. APW13]|uniref:esterase/lipase family protein n=1 Tax=Curvibacter sp. APW13 TaxID=3077236 RepID=UPI0028DE819A|nr:alpha/beta hydrolase [Curvibacter sp. APW13]MDT8992021.1 alpha/beta hydrolase [Curvibacter sp. APW13]
MTKPRHLRLTDLRGISQLAVQATLGINDLVEAMHHTILALPTPRAKTPAPEPHNRAHAVVYRVLQKSSAAVYGAVRGTAKLVGGGLDAALAALQPEMEHLPSTREREAMLAIVNGVLGDHLTTTDNPLCIPMAFRHQGQALALNRAALRQAYPKARSELLVLLHGHCMNDLQWASNDAAPVHTLAKLPRHSTVTLRYNTGRHISHNGRELADLLEQLVQAWPVPVQRLRIVGFSMGGLLARSAVHYAQGHTWPQQLHQLFFVGTPHHGSMVERAGNMVDLLLDASPYSRALSRLGKIRSAGTTDLRHGNLLDEDWAPHDRFAVPTDTRTPVPLPVGVACYAIAAVAQPEPGALRSQWVGDGLVPLSSALGQHPQKEFDLALPPERTRTFFSTTHLGLLRQPEVFSQISRWISASSDTLPDASSRTPAKV